MPGFSSSALVIASWTQCVAGAAVVVLGASGCKSSPSTAPAAGGGTFIVSVTRPENTFVTVQVTGPGGYDARFSATDTLGSLAAGIYTVTTANAALADPVVNGLYTGQVTGSPATIAGTDTLRAAVTYSLLPGTGGLWVGSTNGGSPVAVEYTSANLLGRTAPSLSLPVADADVVFDAAGNLWVASFAGNTVTEYPAAQLVAGTPTAAVTIGGSGLGGPVGLTFDRVGDLWIANFTGNTVVEYTAAQLTASGTPAPAVVLSGPALDNPARLSFDVTGNLWVPNAGANTVVAYGPSQLTATGSPTPLITLSATAGSLAAPRGLAFDTRGDLWVANFTGNTINEFLSGDLSASGSPTPVATLALPAADSSPVALAFDNSGDLWALTVAQSHLIEYTATQLSTGGATAPNTLIDVAAGATSLAFNVPPQGLPLVGPSAQAVLRQRLRG